jgi:hypothetical protein
MSPVHAMALADLVDSLDAAHDAILNLIETAEDYDADADDALATIARAAAYLHDLKYVR